MHSERDPMMIFSDMRGAFEGGDSSSPKERVYAVRDAMLTHRERELISEVSEPDDRTELDFLEIVDVIEDIFESSGYHAPEVFFEEVHAPIGQSVLRQCEIAAINAAHRNGTF